MDDKQWDFCDDFYTISGLSSKILRYSSHNHSFKLPQFGFKLPQFVLKLPQFGFKFAKIRDWFGNIISLIGLWVMATKHRVTFATTLSPPWRTEPTYTNIVIATGSLSN